MKNKIWKILSIVVVILALSAGAVIGFTWKAYREPFIIGSALAVDHLEQPTIENVTRQWFAEWVKDHTDWKVPPAYRVKEAQIISLEELAKGYIEVHYRVTISGWSRKVVSNLNLISTDIKNEYEGQWVLQWKRGAKRWQIRKVMSPVQYQMQTPEFAEEAEEIQTQHFAYDKEKEQSYFVRDEKLYVTYDRGETFIEVPEAYEAVCGTPNGTYDEYLSDNSYLVTEELTAFVGYQNQRTILIYSVDQGKNWSQSVIYPGGYRANTFLSKTEKYCYASFALDRTGGNDYYGSFRSADFENWESVPVPQDLFSNATCVFWKDDNTGYYGKGEGYYLTRDGGASYELCNLPQNDEIIARLGYNPYDSLESMYQKNGIVYMVIGQGDDGDYAENGKLLRALYQSEDGIHFTFVEENVDTMEEAG